MKPIDPIDIKIAIEQGQLAVEVIRNNIIIKDTVSGEAVKIGDMRGSDNE